uniref:Uncharacterized protein n=1 Tax=Fagus sylvatica TaxID=28930 RepID=A0A2N9FFH2_FAGSY
MLLLHLATALSLLYFNTVLLLRLATLICLQLLGSLIRLSQFYFMTVTSPLREVSIFIILTHVCTQSSSSSWFFVSSLIMVVFVDSSKTPKNQFITILSHADEPIEEGITLAVFPSASSIYSSSFLCEVTRVQPFPSLDGLSSMSASSCGSRHGKQIGSSVLNWMRLQDAPGVDIRGDCVFIGLGDSEGKRSMI